MTQGETPLFNELRCACATFLSLSTLRGYIGRAMKITSVFDYREARVSVIFNEANFIPVRLFSLHIITDFYNFTTIGRLQFLIIIHNLKIGRCVIRIGICEIELYSKFYTHRGVREAFEGTRDTSLIEIFCSLIHNSYSRYIVSK